MSSRVNRFLFVGLLVAIGGLLPASGTASAHAELLEVVPADGAVVPEAPSGVTLRFSENVSLTGGSVRVLDDAAEVVADEPTVVGDTVNLPLPDGMRDGTYTVAWAIISADSHRISGASVFHVGAPSATGPVAGGVGSDDDLSWALRAGTTALLAVGYAAVLLAVGLAWFMTLVAGLRDVELPAWPAVVRGVSIAGVIVMIVALPLRAARIGGGLDALSDSSFVGETLRGPLGVSTLVTVIGLIAVAVAAGFGGRRRPFWLVGTGLVALVGFPIEGHTRTTDPGWLMVSFDLLHLTAGAIWVGGIAGLVFAFLSSPDAAPLARSVRRFSAAALGTVVVLAAAGTVMAVIVLPSLSDLWSTGYGRVLLVKVVLVAAVVALGAYNRRWLVPAVGPRVDGGAAAAAPVARRRLVRSVRVELGLLLAVIVVTAILVGRSPQDSSANTAPPPAVGTEVVLSANAGIVELSALPSRTGYFETALVLRDPAGRPLLPVRPPTVELTEPQQALGPLPLEVHEVGPGQYHAFGEVPVPGTWDVDIAVRISDFDLATGTASAAVD